jgi:hypothetical protein
MEYKINENSINGALYMLNNRAVTELLALMRWASQGGNTIPTELSQCLIIPKHEVPELLTNNDDFCERNDLSYRTGDWSEERGSIDGRDFNKGFGDIYGHDEDENRAAYERGLFFTFRTEFYEELGSQFPDLEDIAIHINSMYEGGWCVPGNEENYLVYVPFISMLRSELLQVRARKVLEHYGKLAQLSRDSGIHIQELNKIAGATVKQADEPKTETNSEIKKGTIMSTIATSNRDAALLAAQIKVGQAANTAAVKMIKPNLPLGFGKIADSEFGKLIIANALVMGVSQFAPDNPKAQAIAKAALTSAMIDITNMIDVEKMIDELTGKFTGSSVEKITEIEEQKID